MIELRATSHVATDTDSIREDVEVADAEIVAVELDSLRLHALRHGAGGGRSRDPFLFLLQKLQDVLGKRTGVGPGTDMLTAFEAARSDGRRVALIDQDIRVTMQKLQDIPLREKVKFMGFLVLSPLLFRRTDLALEDVPEQEVVAEVLLRLEVGFPAMYRVLVQERNHVMAARLSSLDKEYGTVLAFLGAGHVQGIREILGDRVTVINTES